MALANSGWQQAILANIEVFLEKCHKVRLRTNGNTWDKEQNKDGAHNAEGYRRLCPQARDVLDETKEEQACMERVVAAEARVAMDVTIERVVHVVDSKACVSG